jgi:dipeptidyl aminopeptidase/acylaminoacyl peptidase
LGRTVQRTSTLAINVLLQLQPEEVYMKTPAENPEGYDDVSLVKRAKDHLHGRLLIVHGTYDDNVHPQNTWAFVDAWWPPANPWT